MSILFTTILCLVIFAALTDLVLLSRRSTLAGALAPAFACFIALESVYLNGLSMFNAVDRFWLPGVHLVFLSVWFCIAMYYGRLMLLISKFRCLFLRLCSIRSVQLLFPLCLLLTMAAILYPPNTYDVLTYHMARVVHWMQNGSVAYYPTAIDRQNVMGPGAEYLILLFQLLSFSDQLANIIQLAAFMVLGISILHLLRLFKVRVGIAGWVMILTVTAPIAIMEASGAKNDLVAAVMTMAIILSCMRLLRGDIAKASLGEFGLAGICFASAFLVKPTALLAALPVLSVGLGLQLPGIVGRVELKRLLKGIGLLLLLIIIVAGPDVFRKQTSGISRHEVYPIFNDYTVDRLWNPVRHFAHNIPFPRQLVSVAQIFGYEGSFITKDVFNPHEDMVGNPFQVSALLVMTSMSLLVWLLLFCKLNHLYLLCLSLSPMAAWVAFGMVIKDQAWITRLQIPLFYLLPFSFIYLNHIAEKKRLFSTLLKTMIFLTAMFSLAYGLLVATHILPRKLVLAFFWGEKPSRVGAYYNNAPSLKVDHNVFFEKVKESGCKRIGLILGPDSVDYPLSWRAMQSGIEVRYLRESIREGNTLVWRFREEDADWPCAIYASYGVPEHVPGRGRQYLSTGDSHTYQRNMEWEFEQSFKSSELFNVRWANEKNLLLNGMEKIEDNKQGIKLVSLGTDPQLLLPLFAPGSSSSAVMKVIIESPVDTEVQFYYMTKKIPYYNEQNSVCLKSRKGENELYFFLPLDDIVGPIRLDPGSHTGVYVLQELEIRRVVNPLSNSYNEGMK